MNFFYNTLFFLCCIASHGIQGDEIKNTSDIQDKIVFGNLKSPIEVYFFTDWMCPGCRSIESNIETMSPLIMKKAKLIFVDVPIHEASTRFTPYNISFMINNKPNYLALRHSLSELSKKTDSPTKEQVELLAKDNKTTLLSMSDNEVLDITKYFIDVMRRFELRVTPTAVVVNTKTGQSQKFEGTRDVSQETILKAIDNLSSPSPPNSTGG